MNIDMDQRKIPIVMDGDEVVLKPMIMKVLAQYGCLDQCELYFVADYPSFDRDIRVFRSVFRVGELLDYVNQKCKSFVQGAQEDKPVFIGPYILDVEHKVLRVLTMDQEIRLTDKELELLNICLLYTSPSPRDRTRTRMPSSA